MKVYTELKNAIKEKGYTQEEFANILGVTRNNLYRKINKGVKFTKLEKEKILELLGIDVDQ